MSRVLYVGMVATPRNVDQGSSRSLSGGFPRDVFSRPGVPMQRADFGTRLAGDFAELTRFRIRIVGIASENRSAGKKITRIASCKFLGSSGRNEEQNQSVQQWALYAREPVLHG